MGKVAGAKFPAPVVGVVRSAKATCKIVVNEVQTPGVSSEMRFSRRYFPALLLVMRLSGALRLLNANAA